MGRTSLTLKYVIDALIIKIICQLLGIQTKSAELAILAII